MNTFDCLRYQAGHIGRTNNISYLHTDNAT